MMEFFGIQKDFPELGKRGRKPLAYFDAAATSLMPKPVFAALREYYLEHKANIHRGVYPSAEWATRKYEEAREKTAKFLNARSSEEIIFTSGTTAGLNMLANRLCEHLQAGDEILLTPLEHHSNLVPWQEEARAKNLLLRFVKLTEEGMVDMEDFKNILNAKTKIVAFCHASNAIGVVNPIEEMAKLARECGAIMVVDGAQSVPHLPIDVQKLGCDFFVFSGHKMLGPTGVGVVWGKKEALAKLKPFQYGGGMVGEVDLGSATWAEMPARFEGGTPPIGEAIALGNAVEYLEKIGMEKIAKHEAELTAHALRKLSAVPSLRIIGPENTNNRIGVIAFTIAGIHPHDIADILGKENIAVRGGHHCAQPLMKHFGVGSTVRASLAFYNTKKEIDRLAEALHSIQKFFAYEKS